MFSDTHEFGKLNLKKMNNRILLAALVSVALVFGMSSFADDYPFPLECEASNSECVIQSDFLSNQDTDPFLFLGRPINKEAARWRQYSRALKKFPNVRTCLVAAEQTVARPNLLLIDWDRVETGRGAEVCIFRIARSVRDLSQMRKWLEIHDFRVSGPNRVFSDNYRTQFPTERVSYLQGNWTIDQYRKKSPSILSSLGLEILQSYYVVINISETGQVVGVGVGTPSK